MSEDAPTAGIPIRLQGTFLALLTCVVYLPVVRCGFIWDDDWYITANAALRSFGGLRTIWLDPTSHPQYFPLVPTTFWLEFRLFGLHALGYHVVNVALHAANAVLVWVVLRRLRVPGAWLAAAVFGVHPVHVESVAWITERKNVLSTFFYLASALCFLRYFRLDRRETSLSNERDREPTAGLYAVGFALFVAALLSKTVTASLPAALLLVMWWKDGRIPRFSLARTAPMFAIGTALGLTTAWLERHHVGAVGEVWSFTPIEKILISGRALWFYAAKLLWPHPLVFIYPRWRIDAGAWWQFVFPIAFVAAIAALWLLRRRLSRGPLVAVLFFAGTLVPALGFFNVFFTRYSFVQDHYQYLASIGWIALLAATGTTVTRTLLAREGRALVGGALVVLILGILTWRQIGIYKDLETLWRDTVTKNPSAWMARTNLGVLLSTQGSIVEATSQFRESIRLEPRQNEARLNLGELLIRQGHVDEAIAVIQDAVNARPDDAMARYNLGTAFARAERFEDALAQLDHALRLRPAFPQARYNLATALLRLGRRDAAESEYRRVLQLDPGHASAHANLASILEDRGKTEEAALHRTHSLRLKAWTLATHEDPARRSGAEAVRLGELACATTGEKEAPPLDALAAAYAEAGRFDDAVATAAKALAIARAAGPSSYADAIERRLESYRAHRPYRDPATRPTPSSMQQGP